MWRACAVAAIAMAAALALMVLGGGTTADAQGGTTITVTSTEDFDGNENKHTCGYTVGGGAITQAAPDGTCTLRRALLEATRRPDADRPIQIEFNIPTTDPNYDAALGIWEVQIDESDTFELTRDNVTVDGGRVSIDGNTQPGGRATGPKIMINTNRDDLSTGGAVFEVRVSDNRITNLGFHGGGAVYLYESDNEVSNIWMGLNNAGTALQRETTQSQALNGLAGGGIIMPTANSDDNIIVNNKIIGATERAIRVTSGGSGNLIQDNWIGMNASGVVDIAGQMQCIRATNFLNFEWYGGEGIQVTGSNNRIVGNVIAGLHKTQTANETPPIAMEIFGTANQVTNNTVGRDVAGNIVGVCGQGLLIGGSQSVATENIFDITRNGFDPSDIGSLFDSAIITQSCSGGGSCTGDFISVYDNVINGHNNDAGNYYASRFADPGVPEVIRKFNPAKVTSVNGTAVEGTNGDEDLMNGIESACGGCTVYLYLDDEDDRIEAFDLVGTATADANGNWSTTISAPLAAGQGLRTQSMSNAFGVIGQSGPGMTSHLSDDLFPLEVVEPEAFCADLLVTINMNTNGGNGTGTAGNDVILGTPGPDVINALGGVDVICGEGGNDIIDGGDDNDGIDGGAGNDVINGGAGNDIILGEGGEDVIDGGTGDDRISGGDDLDTIVGGEGDDEMFGGAGNDRIRGNQGRDLIEGQEGNDFLYGGIDEDTINGGPGNDEIGGFGGIDTLNGGDGKDKIFGGFGADIISGGPGNDTILGLIGNDTINGDDGNDKLFGDNGRDTIFGGNGNDVIQGGNSLDTIDGGNGDDEVSGGKANDTLRGGVGQDTCIGNLGTDTADSTCEVIFGVP
jgi:Ca2+-binding RTX toxin-like protein